MFSAEILKDRIGKQTWLTDEYILVLVKAGEPKDAIKLYVELKEYTKAFNFGEQHNQLTELLSIYLEPVPRVKDYDRLSEKEKKDLKEKFRSLAIQLMQSREARNQLKPLEVLQMIPADWPLKSEDCDLIGFLASIFDH